MSTTTVNLKSRLHRMPLESALCLSRFDLPLQEAGEVFSIIRSDSKHAFLPLDHDTITTPDVPNPFAPRTQMDPPSFPDQGAPDFDSLKIGVPDRGAEEREQAESNGQPFSLILNRQMM